MCGVRDGAAVCWGTYTGYTALPHASSATWLAASAAVSGDGAGCGLFGPGSLTRWASPSSGETPASIGPPDDFVTVESSRLGGACGRRASGEFWCDGPDPIEVAVELGAGAETTLEDRGDGIAWSHVAMHNNGFCGIRASDGALLCWGSNQHGRLGTGRAWDLEPRRVD